MEDPIDVFLVMAHGIGFDTGVFDKPEIEIDGHQRTRIILSAMLSQRFAVDEISDLSL